ncbi:MAG: hypothetical protein HOY79_01640 [Streptomyces sp.]|nr:hypothetical protein [Streptomyces sp.]
MLTLTEAALYAGTTPTKFGRYRVADPQRLDRMHHHRGKTLRKVDHEPPIPVLDQEDLIEQGIDTSALVPGALRVDALGSCTCNAGTASLAERYAAVHGTDALPDIGLSTTDAVADEEYAIRLYHTVTDQTGDPAREWPPTDCGSNGLYVSAELEKQGLTSGHTTAHGILNLVSMLQGGTVIMGLPWLRVWMEPNRLGFIDGSGSLDDLQQAVASGVAGGHETCITAVERLVVDEVGRIDTQASHVRVRNSWSTAFGDSGSFRIHLSTLEMLGQYADFKQLVVEEA